MLSHLSLFSGIGGLDLAAERAGFQTVGQCEWADYSTKVLEKHWPDVPRWKDIRSLTGDSFYERTGLRTVDVVSGGFPCQPFSVAGKRRGKEDDRYLWPEMARIVKELRPTWVIGENVAGIVNMELETVLFDLETEGYATRTFLIPACGVGAPHRRYRTAIVAYSESVRCERNRKEGKQICGMRPKERKSERGSDVCNTAGAGLPNGTGRPMGRQKEPESEFERSDSNVSDTNRSPVVRRQPCSTDTEQDTGKWSYYRTGEEKHEIWEWWSTEPGVGRVAHGVPNRVDRLKCLGNAVVWQQFYPVFLAIAQIKRQSN